MEVILLERIQNLGDLGDQVRVKPGYARNYLIPQHKAVPATPEAKAKVEEHKQELLKDAEGRLETAKLRAASAVTEISMSRRVGEEGKLYGSVTPADIADALRAAGTEIAKSEVHLPEGPIKQAGVFEASVVLHPEVKFTLQVTVVEEADAAE